MGGLVARGLRIVLPDGRALIDDLSLEVAPGEVAVLLGGSGAGKSTFARLLFEPAELARSGFEVIGGELAFDRADLGLVPQRGALFDHLDVRGNLELALRYGRGPADPAAADAASWLERVGLDRALAEPGVAVDRLSGGQAQRVAVARALVTRPELVLADEPTANVDDVTALQVMSLLEEHHKSGATVVLATHNRSLVARFHHPELRIEAGRLVEGTPP